MVRAEYRNNAREYKRFCAFHLLYARGVRAYIFPVLFLLFAVFLVVMGILSGNTLLYVGAAVLLVAAVATPLLGVWVQNARIDKRLRADRQYEKVTQTFLFSQEGLHLTICRGEHTEEYTIPYAQMPRVYERRDVYYIYIGSSQALILRKCDIQEDTAGELQGYFRTLGKHFRAKGAENGSRGECL